MQYCPTFSLTSGGKVTIGSDIVILNIVGSHHKNCSTRKTSLGYRKQRQLVVGRKEALDLTGGDRTPRASLYGVSQLPAKDEPQRV